MMEIWDIWYIDEGFHIWLSRRGINLMNLSTEPVQLVVSLMYISLLMPHSYLGVYTHDTVFHAWFWFRFINTRVLIPARDLAFITPLVGEFLTPLDLHVQIIVLGPWRTSYWSEWRSESVVDQWKTSLWPHPSSPLLVSRVFFCNSWAHFVLFIILYFFIFSHLRLLVM